MMMTPLIGGSLELRYFYFRSASGGQKKIFYHRIGNTQPSGPLLHWLTGICIVLSRTGDKYFLLHGLLSRNQIKITSIVCIMSLKLLEKWKSWKFAYQQIIGGNTMIVKLFNDDNDAADRRKFGAPIFLFSKFFGCTTKKFKSDALWRHFIVCLNYSIKWWEL